MSSQLCVIERGDEVSKATLTHSRRFRFAALARSHGHAQRHDLVRLQLRHRREIT